MGKFQSPLLGYNNNVRHKNRVFHIQTEDSGVNHPHIITHLFMDGGRILKSVKKSYAEHVGTEGMKETVRVLMKEQHKAIFIALRDGQFDYLVDGGPAPAPKAADAAAPVAAAKPAAPAPVSATDTAAASAAAPPTHPDPPRADVDVPVEASPATIAEPERRAVSTGPTATKTQQLPAPRLVLAEPDAEDAPMTTRQPPEARPNAAIASANASASALSVDLDALERAAQEEVSSSLFLASELPPPPKNLFSKEPGSGGAYRKVDVAPPHDPRAEATARTDSSRPAAPAASPPRTEKSPQPPHASPRPAAVGRPGDARYAPARPAAIFGSPQRPPPASLFSDELVSDKSLDEVILSYLAEDLEPPRGK